MAWRFKVSKYKNTAPQVPKKEELLTDLLVGNPHLSTGNHIKASCEYIAFNLDNPGYNNIGILPLNSVGRQSKQGPVIFAHADYVADFDFSPFDDYILASGAGDGTIKIWKLPEVISDNLCDHDLCLPPESKRIENLLWHPSVKEVLAASSHDQIKIWDVTASHALFTLTGFEDQVQSFAWKADGSLIVSTCKDKIVRIYDIRASPNPVMECEGHPANRESKGLWLDGCDLIFTAGVDSMRSREMYIRDPRNLSKILHQSTIDTSTGIVLPLFDPDTGMLYFTGKGDTSIKIYEIKNADPCVTEFNCDHVDQVKGACLIPKLACDVMKAEVARIMILSKGHITPLPYCVPRKTYTEFYAELFPDTAGKTPAMSTSEWTSGMTKEVEKVSLNPARRGKQGDQAAPVPKHVNKPDAQRATVVAPAKKSIPESGSGDHNQTTMTSSPKPQHETKKFENSVKPEAVKSNPVARGVASSAAPPKKTFGGIRQSKFKYLKGVQHHKSEFIENLKKVSNVIPGESDGFESNSVRCAVPIAGPGGLIAVLELNKPGRIPDIEFPSVQCGRVVNDFKWDPFNDLRLIACCDDGSLIIWHIPEGGIDGVMTEPAEIIQAHEDRIYFAKFHPLARDILATAGHDLRVHIWDLELGQAMITLKGHTDTIFGLDWSPDGVHCVTYSKDNKIRLYNPRENADVLQEGEGPGGTRGGRILWACEGRLILVIGFDRQSTRSISVYSSSDLSQTLSQSDIDSSPSILVPHYDEDSSTLFLWSKGESTVKSFEINDEEHPHFFPLSDYTPEGRHLGFSFITKNHLNVSEIEFAKAYRLTSSSVEAYSFVVPRVKAEYFQDDIFPDTRVLWKPSMTSTQWLMDQNTQPERVSLKPDNMLALSDAPVDAPKPKKYDSSNPEEYLSVEDKKNRLIDGILARVDHQTDKPLEQDLYEGCDSDEWEDD